MQKRKKILRTHIYSIWYSEKEDVWYTHLPDESKANKRNKVKRKNKKDLENVIIKYYKTLGEKSKAEKISIMTLKILFYEFVQHKSKEVESGTVKRMMVDWKRFYEPKEMFINKLVKEVTKILFCSRQRKKPKTQKKQGFRLFYNRAEDGA